MTVAVDDLAVPEAVLFDLDGTLVDTVSTRIEAWLEALAEAGYPTDEDQLAPLIGLDGKRLASEIAALAGRPIDEARSEEIDRQSGEIYARLNSSPRALPGVRRLIEAIEDNDISWAIATSSRREQVTASVAALALPTEPKIVDASHVKHAKPEPDLLLLAAKEVDVEPARCWYVGDSTWDMVSAVAAGMIAIGVYAGSAVEPGVLEGAGAAAVVPTLNELADAFGNDAVGNDA
jgi:HAD superfamily hydrolase (TIGR01509 family)